MNNLRSINGALIPNDREVYRVGPFQYQTIQQAVDAAPAGAMIEIPPGTYEAFSVPFGKTGLQLVGLGSFCDVKVAPAAAGARAAEILANRVTVVNIDFIAAATADEAVLVSGDEFRSFGCRYESADNSGAGLHFKSKGLTAYEAGTAGSASIAVLEGNEFCWLESGIVFELYSGLSCTQSLVKGNVFRNCSVACIGEVGVPSVKNVMIEDNLFENMEDGTAPTDYIDLDAAGNTGVLAGNKFACADHASATIQLATGVLYVGNVAEEGMNVARPN